MRSFVQLTAIGYAIKLIFEADSLWLVFALLAVMVVFGALTARSRAKKVPGAFWPLLIALALAGGTTLGLVVALGVFEPTARYLVPVGGMVIGNAMTASAVALNRLGDEMADSRDKIEATLALGATAQEAAAPVRPPRPALGNDHPGRLDQDHWPDLLPRHDGRHAARRRQPDRRRPPAADPALCLAWQRRDRRPGRDCAGVSEFLHPSATAARAGA